MCTALLECDAQCWEGNIIHVVSCSLECGDLTIGAYIDCTVLSILRILYCDAYIAYIVV